MENTTHLYSKILPEFRRQATHVISEQLPGHLKASKSEINKFLKKEHSNLRELYIALIAGFISEKQFCHLFAAIKAVFSLNALKRRGVQPEKTKSVRLLLISLFVRMILQNSEAFRASVQHNRTEQKNINLKKQVS